MASGERSMFACRHRQKPWTRYKQIPKSPATSLQTNTVVSVCSCYFPFPDIKPFVEIVRRHGLSKYFVFFLREDSICILVFFFNLRRMEKKLGKRKKQQNKTERSTGQKSSTYLGVTADEKKCQDTLLHTCFH